MASRRTEEHDDGDPAQAFEALKRKVEDLAGDLTREMTTIRKGVEAAFDEIEKFQMPPDHSPDFKRLMKQFTILATFMQTIQGLPALRHDLDDYHRALENAGNRMIDSTNKMLEQREGRLERIRADLAGSIRSARERQEQNWWLWGSAGAGLVAGVLLTLFLPRALPGSVDMAVASTVMNDERWKAGITLMQSGSPGGWQSIVEASNLVRANQEALSACAEAAAKEKQDQRCTITVSMQAQQ